METPNIKIKVIPEKDGNTVFIYIQNFLKKEESNMYQNWLNKMEDFKDNMNYNKTQLIRQQKWYQMENEYFCPKWERRYDRWKSHEYDDILIQLQEKIQNYINKIVKNLLLTKNVSIQNPKINSCLFNKYKTGKDRIRAHRDTEKSFGEKPTIIGLSLGGEREIKFVRIMNTLNDKNIHIYKKDKENKHLNFKQKLEDGSLFIMAGCSQKYFTHEIPQCNSKDQRYSATFREWIQ
tara:strand:+ start:203 stop:907 length:705 start_codon:yes stop_codon:yes gene_type:complete